MEKLFGLLVITISFDTGVVLHAVQLAFAGQRDDAAWVGVAALTLVAFSVKQAIIIFEEVFSKKVEPRKLEGS